MKRNGFTLLELLIGISLISVVMIFLFKLLNDIQHEGLSNVYVIANQTNRDELLAKYNQIVKANGTISSIGYQPKAASYTIVVQFANNKTMTINIGERNIHLSYESENYNYAMKDENAYYNPRVNMARIDYKNKTFLKFLVKVEKKGLRSTSIDDVEFMFDATSASINLISD